MSVIDSITKPNNYKSYIYKVPIVFIYIGFTTIEYKDRWIDRWIDEKKERERDREKDREREREKDRERETRRERDIYKKDK